MLTFDKKQITTSLIIAFLVAVPSGIAIGAKMYVDSSHQAFQHEFTKYLKKIEGPFLTITEWKLANAESDSRSIKSQIDSLQWDVDNGEATEKDKWLLEQKKKDLEKLNDDIGKLQDNRPTT